MTGLLLLATGCLTAYGALGLLGAWYLRQRSAPLPTPADGPSVTVIVAARNEEIDLPACLDALAAQAYPGPPLTFLIADDHSTDATGAVIDAWVAQDSRFRRILVPASGRFPGKTNALIAALAEAEGDLILTTDADCVPPPGWIQHHAAAFQDDTLGILGGITRVRHQSTTDRIQALDWLLTLSVAATLSKLGHPLTAMGNNLSFRRAAYDAVGGFEEMGASVTEDYALFQAIHQQTRWRAALQAEPALQNATEPLPSLRAALRQRQRWARGGLDAPWWAHVLYGVVYLSHALPWTLLIVAPWVAGLGLGAKLLTDFTLLRTACRRLEETGALRSFLGFEAFLFGYVLAMPFLLAFTPIRWKGRTWRGRQRIGS